MNRLIISRHRLWTVIFVTALCLAAKQTQAQMCPSAGDKFFAPDGVTNANFGYAIAMDGDVAVVGAWLDSDNGPSSGSAYVYRNTGSQWILENKLTASEGEPSDYFGISVAISGGAIVIGAPGVDDFGADSGAAYIFKFNGVNWIEQTKLYASDATAGDWFGNAVALSGNSAIIGAVLSDHNNNGLVSGAAYHFEFDGSVWSQQAILLASDAAAGDRFGTSIAMTDTTLVIGSPENDDNGDDSGSIYIFTKSGTTWNQQGKLLASDGMEYQKFGLSVAISGTKIAVGAPTTNTRPEHIGAVYVYELDRFIWVQRAKLLTSDGYRLDSFSSSVSISGNTILSGAHNSSPSFTGAAYLYQDLGSGWTQQIKFIAPDGMPTYHFGSAVALSGDSALIGSPGDSNYFGSVYPYNLNPPPCPADMNSDCNLDFFDVSGFLSAFGNQDPIADFSGDGLFDFFDVSAFLVAFGAGCP